MKTRFLQSRYMQLLAFLAVLAVLLIVRLFILTVLEHGSWAQTSENISTRSIYTTAPRGEIYDRYGRLLAGNKQSFTIRMSGSKQTDEELNANITTLLAILEKNGDTVQDDFPIVIDGENYSFTYEKEIADWLESRGLEQGLSAEAAFDALRAKMGIDPSLDRYDAQLVMQKTYNQYPPISIVEMEYTAEVEKKKFLQTYFGDSKKNSKMTAEEAFVAIRKEMKIDESLSDVEARKIMVVRNAIKAKGYQQYMPAVVAKNVSHETVMLIEEQGTNIKGVEVVPETTRYYPENNTAAHILGYIGKITDEELKEYKDRGYEANALIGKEGVEGKFEDVLKGTNGEEKVQVNARGELQQVISKTGAVKGKDIYLTIDLELQKTSEDALAKTITAMQTGGSITTEYGTTPIPEQAPKAKTGAVVAIDVETGDVLAMASYPDYDPNLFSEGINEENWSKLQSANLRDSLSPAPLYNLATMSTVQPGSIFKPVTATAALECGLDPNARYMDGGHIDLGGRSFGCVVWNLFKRNHGYIDLRRAIEVSCNYYFYNIATGKDWYTGNSLGYDKKITVDTITDYAEQYGLGLHTGIEINEAVVPVPSEKRKIQGLQATFGYWLYAGAEDYFTDKALKNPKQLKKNIDTMKGWLAEGEVSWDTLYNDMLPSVNIKDDARQEVAEKFLYDLYPQAKWTTGDSFNIAIGQGENAYTPLQLANYVATLGNNGVRNEVSVIKAVEDQGNTVKKPGKKVKVRDDKHFQIIIEGMEGVASGRESTISNILGNLPFDVAAKTGTAERAGKVNPPSEVDYIKEHLGSIAPGISWEEVEKEMNRLMKEYPDTYTNTDTAVRKAVVNLSGVSTAKIDSYKDDYDNFAWVVAMAPASDPKIAVCVMIPQGSTSANAAPVAKEVLQKYFDLEKEYTNFKIKNIVQ